jgi:hypothetical protein
MEHRVDYRNSLAEDLWGSTSLKHVHLVTYSYLRLSRQDRSGGAMCHIDAKGSHGLGLDIRVNVVWPTAYL